jgi:hypothetical protein
MKIVVENKGFDIDGQRLIYNLYYFDGDEYDAPTLGATFKKILIKWSNMLQDLNTDHGPLFLPFAPDDEWIECLKAIQHGDRIVLRYVEVAENGWAIDTGRLEEFMTSPHVLDNEASDVFGDYDKEEFISALIDAHVSDEY